MAIKQFNATYSKDEDRILLRFNTDINEEYRFWMTRFITDNLLRMIDQLLQKSLESKHDSRTAGVIKEFQEDGVRKTTNLKQEYYPATSFPLGDQALLITGFSGSLIQDKFTLKINFKAGKNISLNLPKATIQALNYLLKQVSHKAAWGLIESQGNITSSPVEFSDKHSNFH